MSILVTGAAGFIGSHLTERLLTSGHRVVGLDNFDRFYDPAIKQRNLAAAHRSPDFLLIHGDVREPSTYDALPDDVEAVIHLAARAGVRPSIESPLLYFDVNVGGTMRILEYMRDRGIRKLLFGSSSSVYGDTAPVPFSESDPADRPISPYAATKRSGELLVHSHHHLFGIDALCLRFFTVFGPRQRPDLAIHKFARLMVEGRRIPMYGDGSSERDYTEVEDILDGIEGALGYVSERPGTFEIVNLGGARTTSLRRMIDLLGAAIGVDPAIEALPDQPGDVRRTYADVTRARALFGYEPSVPFEDGIDRFASWFLSERAAHRSRSAA